MPPYPKNLYKRTRSPKLGDLVEVTFLDHANYRGIAESGGYITARVIGQIMRITDKSYELGVWITEDVVQSENNDNYSILTSTIENISILKRGSKR